MTEALALTATIQQKLDSSQALTNTEREFVFDTVQQLDQGKIRVCEKKEGAWITHSWIKQNILFYFRLTQNSVMEFGKFSFFDKVPVKNWSALENVRVVPPAVARYGSFVEKGAILMPSYVNIGAYVGSGTMVDTWATVGSCAQVGRNVHLSGGVGLGGVLEPVQATPVIVEDDVFIGSRSIVVEGAVIEEGAVLGAGVVITATTRIVDVTGAVEKTYRGRVPKNAVVIPGSTLKKFPAGEYAIPSALIIGFRSEQTDKKTSLNSALRLIPE